MKTNILKFTAPLLVLAGCFFSCTDEAIYVWPKGPKYYYAFDEKILLYEVPNKIVISFDGNYLSEIQQYLQGNTQIRQIDNIYIHNNVLILITEISDVTALMEDLKKRAGMKSVNPMYVVEDGLEIGITDEIVVQFKEHTSQQKINNLHKKYRLDVKEITELFQLLSVPIDIDPLEVANAIQESGLVNFSHPNFIAKKTFCNSKIH